MTETRTATRERLVAHACHSLLHAEWHWFKYYVKALPLHPFAYQMVEAILDCDGKIERFGDDFLEVSYPWLDVRSDGTEKTN